MDKGFWIFGGILSVGAHFAILMLFLIGACGRQQETLSEEDVAEAPVPAESPAAPPTEVRPAPAHEAPGVPKTEASALRDYEVRPGDTLSAIARRIGCTVDELAEINKSSVRKLSRLRVGQRLLLPE